MIKKIRFYFILEISLIKLFCLKEDPFTTAAAKKEEKINFWKNKK